MIDEQAREGKFNPETGEEARAEKILGFVASGVRLTVRLSMPQYVYKALGTHHWDRMIRDVHQRAESYVQTAAANGTLIAAGGKEFLGMKVQQYACQRLYEMFMETQEQRGNDAWEVPAALQSHTLG